MNLADLEKVNSLAASKVASFRSSTSLDLESPHTSHFHKHKNTYKYFGFIEIEIHNCEPFVMFSCNDDLIAMTYFWYGANAYERKSITEWVARSRRSKVVLDVGAFTGLYSLAAVSSQQQLKNAKVYAFEPTRRVHSRLLLNIQVNKMSHLIEPVNLAVSNRADTVRFFQYRGDQVLGNGASFIDKGIEIISDDELVSTISIDSFVEKEKIKPELMKIDVEQAEILALEGMQQTLSNYGPTIILEVAPNTVAQATSILSSHGYKQYVIDEEKQTLISLENASKKRVLNLLAEK